MAKILAKERPKGKRGGDKCSKAAKEKQNSARSFGNGTYTKAVLATRLQQEHPDHYQAYLDGEHKSIRAAAEAAGIVKPGHDPLMRLKAF